MQRRNAVRSEFLILLKWRQHEGAWVAPAKGERRISAIFPVPAPGPIGGFTSSSDRDPIPFLMNTPFTGPDGWPRCHWCGFAPEFLDYHDAEWGFPVADDFRLFEKLSLEGFQSGLSWRTILVKRGNFRSAFHHFDFHRIARFTGRDVERLLKDDGIVRHRGKIEAVINNAQRACELARTEGSLAAYLWRHEPDPRRLGRPQSASTSAESIALSKDLKKRGWKFVGPTTVYAFMQAVGLINDHAEDCVVRAKAETARKAFRRPAGNKVP